jgi:putative restriction endonuclease
MTPQATMPSASVFEDDPCFYPNHEEDDVPEGTLHNRWSRYLIDALDARFPDRFVAGNICVYWERGNPRDYLSPDTFVAQSRLPEPPPRIYRAWLYPPLLFAAEIGSVNNTRVQQQEKRGRYAQFLRPLELLETEPINEEDEEVLTLEHLHLYRLTDQGYEEQPRQPNGRVRSETLELEIGVDAESNLRLYTLTGDPLLTYEEEQQARLAAEQAHLAAEQARLAAEQGAAKERAQREALERELAELRARLAQDSS